jgi:iron complex transport system substrate-binding protein
MVKWMAQVQHPDLFTYDMREEVKNYYKEFYNYVLTDDQVEGILSSNPEAARGANWSRR